MMMTSDGDLDCQEQCMRACLNPEPAESDDSSESIDDIIDWHAQAYNQDNAFIDDGRADSKAETLDEEDEEADDVADEEADEEDSEEDGSEVEDDDDDEEDDEEEGNVGSL